MAKNINLKINNIPVNVPEGTTILEAARLAHIEIPTLCYLKDVNCVGSCRMCLVEATGARGLVAACVYPVAEGMEVRTNTEKCRQSRHSLECSDIKLRTRAVAIVAESCIAYKFESQFLRIIVQYVLIECADAVNKFLHKHFKLCGSLFVFFLCP